MVEILLLNLYNQLIENKKVVLLTIFYLFNLWKSLKIWKK